MVDNINVDPGTGVGAVPVATDDVGGVQYQIIKIVTGGDGVATPLSNAAPLPISDAGGSLTVDGTVAVTGTVAATQSGTWNAVVTTLPVQFGAGASTGTTQRVTIDTGQIGSLVAGGVPVVSGGYEYQTVAASATGTVLQVSAGVTGDYLESILCIVANAATSQVMIGDGAAPAIVILPNAVGAGVGTYPIPLGLTSKTGSWRVTTAAGVSIIATGNFS